MNIPLTRPGKVRRSRFLLLPLAVLALAGTLLSGCANTGTGNTPAPASNTPPAPKAAGKTVGVALASMNHNFFIGMRQGVEEELAAEGLQGEIVVAEDSASAQQQQADQLIQKGVSAIIMVPVDAKQAVNPVKAANAAKIPIFCIDRRVTDPGARVTCTVETDNVAMGEMAARYGLQLLCQRHKLNAKDPAQVKTLKTTVVHLWGLEAASSAQDRARGFDRVFNKQSTPGVKLLKAVGNFNAKTSQEVMAPLLTANPEVELVFCHNDDNAVGALNAVVDVKKGREKADDPRRIFIVGMDGNKAAIEAIRKGDIEGTVSQEPLEMGRETVKQVRKVLDGSAPDKPYVAIPHHLVTKKEAEEKQGKLWSDLLKGGV
jgi:ribose transport system substrate-binding protein